jgi:serine phosphatase RsbU (regulator of sigma subunit)
MKMKTKTKTAISIKPPATSIEQPLQTRPASNLRTWLQHASKRIPLSLAAILFIGIFVLDSAFLIVGGFPRLIRSGRDLIFVVGMLFMIPALAASRFGEQRHVKRALLTVFWGILAINALIGIVDLLFWDHESSETIFSSTRIFFATGLTSLLVAIVTLGLWLPVRSLIYHKSKRTTARNFRLLIMVGLVYLGYRIFIENDTRGFFDGDNFSKIILFVLITLMVVNSLRVSWIRHLNRAQKWGTLWLGAIVLTLAIAALNVTTSERFGEYSIALAAFISSSFLFFAIYTGITLLTLLLQLPTAGMFDEKMREIQTLHELSRSVISELEVSNLVRMITEKTMQVTNANAAWLQIIDEPRGKLQLASAVNLAETVREKIELDQQQGVSAWIFQHCQPLLVNETENDARTAYLKKWRGNIAALIAVPLLSKGRVIGVLFAAKSDPWSFDEFDRDMLQAFADQAAVAIDNARLWKESIEKERLAQELRVAHEAQMKLLPKRMPIAPNLDIDALSITANEVGGDYFDFFEYPERMGLVIGDVSGKGPAAAFHMAEVKGIIESYSRIYASPREVLIHANAALHRSIERSTFVSLIYANIDFEGNEMIYSRAGHCPVIFVRRDEPPRFLQPAGLALGLDEGKVFEKVITEDRIKLQRDDILIFYTDGVTEAMDAQSREFEESRLLELATSFYGKSSREIREAIVNAVRGFMGPAKSHDDYTVVVLKRK